MPYYPPQTLYQRFLDWTKDQHNFIGRKARREVMNQYGPRAVSDFEAGLAGVGRNHVCIDLRGNMGVSTEKLARTGTMIHDCESDPYAFDIAFERVGHLSNVILHKEAVAMEGGTFTMRRSAQLDRKTAVATGRSTIVFDNPKKFKSEGLDVTVRAFRAVLAEIAQPVAIVKMGVEGPSSTSFATSSLLRPRSTLRRCTAKPTNARSTPNLPKSTGCESSPAAWRNPMSTFTGRNL